MKIVSIHILRAVEGIGDRVILYTDLPESVFPFEGNLSIEFRVARGTAEEYVNKCFPGIPCTVQTVQKYRPRFSRHTSDTE